MKCPFCKEEIKREDIILRKDYDRQVVVLLCPLCGSVLFRMTGEPDLLEGIFKVDEKQSG
jgi:predicted RNA-binding Zn-ribbon protein involved in translation (DUF1610 family)